MHEPSETPYAMWLTDFCSDDAEHNVKTETDFSTVSITGDRIGVWHLPNTITADKIVCGTLSSVSSILGVGLTLKMELEKARARIAELEADLSTAQQRIAVLEAKPVKVSDDQDCWMMPRSLLPRGI